jgi:hypothetical protein
MQFFGRTFFASRIGQYTSPHDVHPADHGAATCANANYQSCFLSHGEKRRAKTQACPARRPISLASAYLVRVTGAPVKLGGVP